jgi:hypothetical protein
VKVFRDGNTPSQALDALVKSPASKSDAEFLEVHIFDGYSWEAIESVAIHPEAEVADAAERLRRGDLPPLIRCA